MECNGSSSSELKNNILLQYQVRPLLTYTQNGSVCYGVQFHVTHAVAGSYYPSVKELWEQEWSAKQQEHTG